MRNADFKITMNLCRNVQGGRGRTTVLVKHYNDKFCGKGINEIFYDERKRRDEMFFIDEALATRR